MAEKANLQVVWKLGFLIALVVALLFVATWIGLVRCSTIPFWCDAYWGIMRFPQGEPSVLIVMGDDGLGDAELLQQAMQDPSHLGVRAQIAELAYTSIGNLRKHDLVIVTHAKSISTKKLKMFADYVTTGGRLVWTGDAGTAYARDENKDVFLYEDDLDLNAAHDAFGPWARKKGDEVVRFDYVLGVKYRTNYCEVKKCENEPLTYIGKLEAPDRFHRLVNAIKPGLVLHGDFSIVEALDDATITNVLNVNYQSNLIGSDGEDYGRTFPIIIASAPTGVGERVAYYAIPPENLVRPENKEKFYSILENMYYGMLK
ncbi:MAG: hypothetical protein J4415_01100 [Candidatus Diapherotrites archaeon]|uniref:Uncharacterized protein n=1 Tax=Candidatus Iainarchaeum sp. TaxID=3101447 RepID=A0A8T4L287_9ARCH|nr:hypothetical protein [Candidatus Diapherotrites archaeon]